MDKTITYAITVVLCILFQMGLAPAIQIMGARPDFLLIPVLFISMRSGAGAGGASGFLLGLLYDFTGDTVVGAMAFTYCLVALIVGMLSHAMETTPFMAAVLGLIFGFVSEPLYGLATVLGSVASNGAFETMLAYSVPSGIYTAVICAVALLTMSLVTAVDSPSMGGGLGFGGRR